MSTACGVAHSLELNIIGPGAMPNAYVNPMKKVRCDLGVEHGGITWYRRAPTPRQVGPDLGPTPGAALRLTQNAWVAHFAWPT